MIHKLTRTSYTETTFSTALLIIRIGAGALMFHHGYSKLSNFNEYQQNFMNFLGLGSTISLSLVIFAECFCSAMIVIGFFTSLFTLPLIFSMGVALFMAHGGAIFAKGELATLYLFVFVAIMIVGPGKYSLDAIIANRISPKK